MSASVRAKLQLPEGHDKLLLHSCCAPCSGEVMEALIESEVPFAIFFYNPNIHPVKEYLIRKDENIRFAEKHNIPFIDCDYDTDNWFARAKGMENEPERGIRCTMCFDMRFEHLNTAQVAPKWIPKYILTCVIRTLKIAYHKLPQWMLM